MMTTIKTGDPIWIPAGGILYFPDTAYPQKYKVFEKPICAWFVDKVNTQWAKIMYENTYWSVNNTDIFPYPQQEQK